jgi:hypothetical protein
MNAKKKIKAVPTQDAYNSHNNSKCLNVALIIASKFVGMANPPPFPPPNSVVDKGVDFQRGKLCKVSAANIGERQVGENAGGK